MEIPVYLNQENYKTYTFSYRDDHTISLQPFPEVISYTYPYAKSIIFYLAFS